MNILQDIFRDMIDGKKDMKHVKQNMKDVK